MNHQEVGTSQPRADKAGTNSAVATLVHCKLCPKIEAVAKCVDCDVPVCLKCLHNHPENHLLKVSRGQKKALLDKASDLASAGTGPGPKWIRPECIARHMRSLHGVEEPETVTRVMGREVMHNEKKESMIESVGFTNGDFTSLIPEELGPERSQEEISKFWSDRFEHTSPFMIRAMSFHEATEKNETKDELSTEICWTSVLLGNVLEGVSWKKIWSLRGELGADFFQRNDKESYLTVPERLSMVHLAPGLPCNWMSGYPVMGVNTIHPTANFDAFFCLAKSYLLAVPDPIRFLYPSWKSNDEKSSLDLASTLFEVGHGNTLDVSLVTGPSLMKDGQLMTKHQDCTVLPSNCCKSLFLQHKENAGEACIVFVSHRWLDYEHPDPDGKDMALLRKMFYQLASLCMKVIATLLYLGITVDQLAFVGENFPIASTRISPGGTIATDLMCRMFNIAVKTLPDEIKNSSRDEISSAVPRLVDAWFDDILSRLFFWVDYCCIPQKPRDEHQDLLFKRTLKHLLNLRSAMCTLTIGAFEASFTERAWCFVEYVFAEECSKIDVHNTKKDMGTHNLEKIGKQAQSCRAFLGLTATEPEDVLNEMSLKITNGKDDAGPVCSLMWEGVQGLLAEDSDYWFQVFEKKSLTLCKMPKVEALHLLELMIKGDHVSWETWMSRLKSEHEPTKKITLFLHYQDTPPAKRCWEVLRNAIVLFVPNESDIVSLSLADASHESFQEQSERHPVADNVVTICFANTIVPFGCTTHVIPEKPMILPTDPFEGRS